MIKYEDKNLDHSLKQKIIKKGVDLLIDSATDIVKSIPIVGGIANIIKKAVDSAYNESVELEFKNKVTAINKLFSVQNDDIFFNDVSI